MIIIILDIRTKRAREREASKRREKNNMVKILKNFLFSFVLYTSMIMVSIIIWLHHRMKILYALCVSLVIINIIIPLLLVFCLDLSKLDRFTCLSVSTCLAGRKWTPFQTCCQCGRYATSKRKCTYSSLSPPPPSKKTHIFLLFRYFIGPTWSWTTQRLK